MHKRRTYGIRGASAALSAASPMVAKALFAIALAAALALAVGMFSPTFAYADTEEIDAAPSDLQQLVEQTSAAYNEATAKLEEAEKLVTQNEARIADLQVKIPAQREKSSDAMRALYKMQRDGYSIISAIVDAGDFGEFMDTVTYLNYLQDKNLYEISHLTKMEGELVALQKDLTAKRDEAKAEQATAKQALDEAMAARQKAIEEARAAAQREAEEAARRAAEAEAQNGQGGSNGSQQPGSDGSQGGGSSEPVVAPAVDPVNSGNTDRDAFVAEWAPRIDAYMAGSPLAGYGVNFAAAAWDYGVDPRWSPAISCIESTKGEYCFRNHNAWGWGSVDWDTWEEAIDDHVRGLARGYGYTVSEAAAKKYCPPNWEFWYRRVSEEMNKI